MTHSYARLQRVAFYADLSTSASEGAGGLNMPELFDFIKKINSQFGKTYKTSGLCRKDLDKLIRDILLIYSQSELESVGIVGVDIQTSASSQNPTHNPSLIKPPVSFKSNPTKSAAAASPTIQLALPSPYGIKIIDHGGGGHCFYYVAAAAISQLTGKPMSMSNLRSHIAAYIRSSVSDDEIAMIRSVDVSKPADIARQRELFAREVEDVVKKEWASAPIISYTSILFKIRFIMYNSRTGTFKCLDGFEHTDRFQYIACIAYNGSHYTQCMVTESEKNLFSFAPKDELQNPDIRKFFKAISHLYWSCQYDTLP
jgi:hypothetical protein